MRLKIKQLGDVTATAGLHMGGDRKRRKLAPYEVVDVPENLTAKNIKGENIPLYDILLNTGKVEITLDDVTRPFEFGTEKLAKITSPTYTPTSTDDIKEQEAAFVAVAELVAPLNAKAEPDVKESVSDSPTDKPKTRSRRRSKSGGSTDARVST